MERKPWTRDELILALSLYWQLPFGRLHHRTQEIIDLARALGRSSNSVAMKLSNFAGLDPELKARGIKGLASVSALDRDLFAQYLNQNEKLIEDADRIASQIHLSPNSAETTGVTASHAGPTESLRETKVRLAQAFFRRMVIASYSEACGMCRLDVLALLQASHIIPWSEDESRRVDPTNGIALCALHDKAFDRGLLTLDSKLKIVLSPRLRTHSPTKLHRVGLTELEGQDLYLPDRFSPDLAALEYHRERRFLRE